MKKNQWKILIAVVAVIVVVFLVYRSSNPHSFSQDMEEMKVMTEAGPDAYTVEASDVQGNINEINGTEKERLVQLILSAVTEKNGKLECSEDTPALNVKIIGQDTSFEALLQVYDQGEATNEGLLQTTNDTYVVENCGEVLNYLAELGFYTER